jgi:hypothetical protein
MSFEFIDNKLGIDQAARKQIRRHAAMGKNRGKTTVRSSRNHASTTTISSFHPPGIIGKEAGPAKGSSQIERPIDDGLDFPAPVFGESRALVKKGIAISLTQRCIGCADDLFSNMQSLDSYAPHDTRLN